LEESIDPNILFRHSNLRFLTRESIIYKETFDSIESYESSKKNEIENNNTIIEKFADSFELDVEEMGAG